MPNFSRVGAAWAKTFLLKTLLAATVPSATPPNRRRVRFMVSSLHLSLALVGFRGGGAGSRNQACDKGAEQGSPTPARVVHELEEAEIERQLVLRDAPVRAEPGAQ